MKRNKVNTTLIICFSLIFFLSTLNGNVCNSISIVSRNGNNINPSNFNSLNNIFEDTCIFHVGGSGSKNYSSIQKAIIDSKDGDIIYVWDDSSPYYENIFIDKKIKLIGEDKNTTVIDGQENDNVISVMIDEVFISGFKIINSGKNWPDAGIMLDSDKNNINGNIISHNNYGIYSYNLEDSIVIDNMILNNSDSGIHFPFSNNITISDNIINNNQLKGIYLYDSNVHCYNRNTISCNTIENNKEGIFLWFSYRTDIINNTITNNQNGISFNHNSEYNKISNNTIIKNYFNGIFFNSSSRNEIQKNIITQNINGINLYYSSKCNIINNSWVGFNENGLFLNYSMNTYILDNKFINNNNFGIYLKYSTKNNIRYNNIMNNDNIGIFLNHNSRDNIIEYNNLINQDQHAFFENTLSNKWSNNYWDDWNKKGSYIIYGTINIFSGLITLNWINFDFYPSEYKYS